MSTVDYAKLYDEYWTRPDRHGSHSFDDAAALAERILRTCGGGPLVDVGAGMGLLVRTLLRQGVDARGVDVSAAAVAYANERTPGRFQTGSLLQLPFEADSFDTVVSTDVFEHLAEGDVPQAAAELCRVCRRYAYVVLSTAPDRDQRWHLTVRARDWWEQRFFEAGFRRHPLLLTVVPYEALEAEGRQITLIFEKIPAAAVARYPLAALLQERTLHMDMLREAGRRADAHLARYALALRFVRPNDTVLDIACGLGYGGAVLAAGSAAARVVGVDNSASAIEYARANYGAAYPQTEYRRGDAAELSFLQDDSADLVVCLETLEHLADPPAFLREINRVLRPTGRILVSVPNQWIDETGRDPNPHHLQVYTWSGLREQLERQFLPEKCYAQTAGGGMKHPNQPRRLAEVTWAAAPREDPEWWLAAAMKAPFGRGKADYRESMYAAWADIADCHLVAFARDYDNPWLARAIVMLGARASDPALLTRLARQALATARPGSADAGAALCVLAYRLLEQEDAPAEAIRAHLERIAAFQRAADDSPHAWRWRISNEYAAGRLWLAVGARDDARRAFSACANMDCLRFSPLLATKTVDAAYMAGLLALSAGERDAAAQWWRRGVEETRRAAQGDWAGLWGAASRPLPFALPEIAELAEIAARCANGLLHIDDWSRRPGFARAAIARQGARDQRDWSQQLAQANVWLEQQCRNWENAAHAHEATLHELRDWIRQLEEAKQWLAEQRDNWELQARQAAARVRELEERLAKTAGAEAAAHQDLKDRDV